MDGINLSGIYDKRTLKLSKELGLKSFGFDFRPRSMNFIQQHILDDLLPLISLDEKIFIHFQNEADFVVENLLKSFVSVELNPTILFTDAKELEYYESFQTPFYCMLSEDINLSKVLSSKLCAGLILRYSDLENLRNAGKLHGFISDIYKLLGSFEINSKKIMLDIDWNTNIAPSVIELVDFDYLNLPINDQVEVCYRNVDSSKLKANLEIIKNLTC